MRTKYAGLLCVWPTKTNFSSLRIKFIGLRQCHINMCVYTMHSMHTQTTDTFTTNINNNLLRVYDFWMNDSDVYMPAAMYETTTYEFIHYYYYINRLMENER